MSTQSDFPKFSIVLPSYNTVAYLKETIDSVLAQDYPDFEFIITDGGSTDGTVALLETYGDKIRWVSEPDNGQSDAINKGFEMATGDLHYWANADDPMPPGTLRHVAGLLTDLSRPQWCVGAADLIDEKGGVYFTRTVDEVNDATFYLWALKWIPTQSVFWNAKMWEAAGPFDAHFHYTMDLGLWQRMHKAAPCIVTDRVCGLYRMHDVSKSLSSVETSRAERKRNLAGILARDLQEAADAGPDAVQAKAEELARLFDELSDHTAFLHRLEDHKIMGPLIRAYRKRVSWSPSGRL
ncbi:glycosyltransferase family 2 protein [Primorskyibacter sp. S187A]|uniref:glycosyltransferase family 2 protein n=1 Tax=Primorskyibacter sp. S187A TaxID=3415130 RepID=UPI003C79BB04